MSTIMGMKALSSVSIFAHDRLSAERNVEDAPRGSLGCRPKFTFRSQKVHNIAKRSSKPRSIARAQKFTSGDQSPNEIFLGRLEPAALRRFERSDADSRAVEADVPHLLSLMRELAELKNTADDFAVTEESAARTGVRRSPARFLLSCC